MEKCRWVITFADVRGVRAIIERAQDFLRNFNGLGTSTWHALCLAARRSQDSSPQERFWALSSVPLPPTGFREPSLTAIISPSIWLITLTFVPSFGFGFGSASDKRY